MFLGVSSTGSKNHLKGEFKRAAKAPRRDLAFTYDEEEVCECGTSCGTNLPQSKMKERKAKKKQKKKKRVAGGGKVPAVFTLLPR